jgi:hypothetical protein
MADSQLLFDLLAKNEILDNLPSIMERIKTYHEIQADVTKNIRKILKPRGLEEDFGGVRHHCQRHLFFNYSFKITR